MLFIISQLPSTQRGNWLCPRPEHSDTLCAIWEHKIVQGISLYRRTYRVLACTRPWRLATISAAVLWSVIDGCTWSQRRSWENAHRCVHTYFAGICSTQPSCEVDALAFAFDRSNSSTMVIIISADATLSYALSILHLRNHHVVLISPATAPPELRAQASLWFDWMAEVVKDEAAASAPNQRGASKSPSRAQSKEQTQNRQSLNTPQRPTPMRNSKIEKDVALEDYFPPKIQPKPQSSAQTMQSPPLASSSRASNADLEGGTHPSSFLLSSLSVDRSGEDTSLSDDEVLIGVAGMLNDQRVRSA